jgi:outer membrane protein OmpA-like peptidoglycan-associated protein
MFVRQGYAAIAALIAASAAAAGCASREDETLNQTRERVEAALVQDSFRSHASEPLADAVRMLAQAEKAKGSSVRRHFTYMAEKNLEIAEVIVTRSHAEREIEALRRAEKESAVEVLPVPAQIQPDRDEAAADLVSEVSRERLEAAIREAREAQARAEKFERKLQTQTRADQILQAPEIHFAAGSAELTPGAKRRLDQLVVRLLDDESIHAIVEGYTDSTGTPEANLQISLARASAVKSYLVENGVSEERVLTLAHGARYQVASNETEEGRQRNRRVEIVLDQVGGTPVR